MRDHAHKFPNTTYTQIFVSLTSAPPGMPGSGNPPALKINEINENQNHICFRNNSSKYKKGKFTKRNVTYLGNQVDPPFSTSVRYMKTVAMRLFVP